MTWFVHQSKKHSNVKSWKSCFSSNYAYTVGKIQKGIQRSNTNIYLLTYWLTYFLDSIRIIYNPKPPHPPKKNSELLKWICLQLSLLRMRYNNPMCPTHHSRLRVSDHVALSHFFLYSCVCVCAQLQWGFLSHSKNDRTSSGLWANCKSRSMYV